MNVDMYGSTSTAYDMGARFNEWFSQHFGFEVILAYWGHNTRPVLGNLPKQPINQGPRPKSLLTNILNYVPILGSVLRAGDAEEVIAFNDCAPYLIITSASAQNVSSRLSEGEEMDITKFRANIILHGSPAAFDEDFWAELNINGSEGSANTQAKNGTKIILTSNCLRCESLNVDYETGKFGEGKAGEVLKLLSRDRRVDMGIKYSPVFGRYGFLGRGGEGCVLRVGDGVSVGRRNEVRTKFCEFLGVFVWFGGG